VVFVEVLRLITVLAGALIGLSIGQSVHNTAGARVLGAGVGVLLAYVLGGGAGRLIDRGYKRAARQARDLPAAELLAGILLGALGLVVGVVACLPIFVFVKQDYDYPVTAGVAWILGYLGLRIGTSKGGQLADAAHLTRRLDVNADVTSGGLVVDTSAIMDRAFLVLGSAGLLGREVLVPEPVADELRTLADGPDPVSSRRARRALEAIGTIRAAGVEVTVVSGDVPEASMTEEKTLVLAQRLGARLLTSSAEIARQQADLDVVIVDLRSVVTDLAPDHVPGERLLVDLVRAGRQAGQAVGYLPDGDMVVVNEADHLVGTDDVEVSVLSTRPTSQGLLVFAQLRTGAAASGGAGA
jgi:uncharacterized protein YacL